MESPLTFDLGSCSQPSTTMTDASEQMDNYCEFGGGASSALHSQQGVPYLSYIIASSCAKDWSQPNLDNELKIEQHTPLRDFNMMEDSDHCRTLDSNMEEEEQGTYKSDSENGVTVKRYKRRYKSKRVKLDKGSKLNYFKGSASAGSNDVHDEDGATCTPILNRKETQRQFTKVKSENEVDPALDISPFVKSSRYGQANQKFKLFWLPNCEVSSLMRVPSIAQMSSSRKDLAERLYILFTPGGIDIIQDASQVKGVEDRPFHTPFIILYSYSFRCMYFKVVDRVIGSCSMVTFGENGEYDTVVTDTSEKHNRRSQPQDPDSQSYEFYRSYLYGIDDGAPTKRITVALRHLKETVIDMREQSVEDEFHGRFKSTVGPRSFNDNYAKTSTYEKGFDYQTTTMNKRLYEQPHPLSNDSMEFDGGVSVRSNSLSKIHKRPEPRHKLWVYERTDDHDESDEDTIYGVPSVLLAELKRLLGLEEVSKLLQCNLSMVNQRTEAMIKRNFLLYERDDTCITADVKDNFEVINSKSSNGQDMYRVGNRILKVGDVIVVKMPGSYRGHPEEDIIKIYHPNTIRLCFRTLEVLSAEVPTDLKISLAQYCPNIFWNIVLSGDMDSSLREMAPNFLSNSRRRRPVSKVTPPAPTPTPTRVVYKANNTPVFDNNFLIMQNLFERDAQHKIKRLEEIRRMQNGSHCKITRNGVSKYLDKDELISAVMDSEGLLLRSMQSLTPHQKMVVYKTCLRRGLYAPIRLDYVNGKGRAVFAAYDIGKEEYIVEYKGQIITEKLAKFRDRKYDQSRSYKGSFVFYFKLNNKRYCIDSTEEDIVYGPARLINHSRKNPNIIPKALEIDKCPRLFFVAKRDIKCGEELLIDYGERDPSVIKDNPWLLD
ncbi:SET domain containing protein [Babesia gibsoni]|uniref:SET domain containing protein n=1 Tax=Babesia gibsoni TaxID=33632 RepID=A0AAD8PCJ2_BABGI|nr:SET domain containing protein [Babesia gibsoni]